MCQSMVNIQSPTAEIRRGKKKKEEERRRKKKQDENIMVCPITQGDHKNSSIVKLTWIAKFKLMNIVLSDNGVMDPGIISLQQPQQHNNST